MADLNVLEGVTVLEGDVDIQTSQSVGTHTFRINGTPFSQVIAGEYLLKEGDDVTSNQMTGNLTINRIADSTSSLISLKPLAGASSGVQMYDGTNLRWYAYKSTGNAYTITGYDANGANGKNNLRATYNAEISLYYQGSVKLATKSGGVAVTGDLSADTLTIATSATIGGDTVITTTNGNNTYYRIDGTNNILKNIIQDRTADAAFSQFIQKAANSQGGILRVRNSTNADVWEIRGNIDASGNANSWLLYSRDSSNANTKTHIQIDRSTSQVTLGGPLALGANSITTTGTVNAGIALLNGEIIASSAALQVNGFMRTGNIYIHEGGNTPTATNALLSNVGGNLEWNGSRILRVADEGSGNGIDADTVDGIQGANLLRSDIADVYAGRTLAFGIPGNGTNTSGCFLSIEGNTGTDGEGSGRLFFREHNATQAQEDLYGVSFGYRGGLTAVTAAGGSTWNGLSQIGNGQWGMWGHDNSLDGALIMYGDRNATFVNFAGNAVNGIGALTSASLTSGNATFDNGTSTTVNIVSDDAGESVLRLYGVNQGSGRVYVGQSTTHGGGIEYNGDNSPAYSGAGSDYIALYRVAAGVADWTARNYYNTNDWQFRDSVIVSGTTNATTTATGALRTSGGLGVALDARIGGDLHVTGSTFLNVAGTNIYIESDTSQRIAFAYRQGATSRWNVYLDANGDLNHAPVASEIFKIAGSRVLTTADEGSGNGLDADTVDGVQAASFLRSDTNTETSGTLTGSGIISDANYFGVTTDSSRYKYRLYGTSTSYSIGMQGGVTFGHLNDWAMTFQFNDQATRGFWWGDEGHGVGGGAMALTTDGKLNVATSLSVGEGETATAPSSDTLYVYGTNSKFNSNGHTNVIIDGNGGSTYYQSLHIGESGMGAAAVHLQYRGDGLGWLGMGDTTSGTTLMQYPVLQMGYTTSNCSFFGQVAFQGGTKIDTAGDVYARRSNGTTGVYYFVDGGSKYLYWDGSKYNFGGNFQLSNGTGTITGGSIQGSDLRTDRYIYDKGDTTTYIDMNVGTGVGRFVGSGTESMRWGAAYTMLIDNTTLRLGTSSDFRMWHDGTNHYFRNYNHANGNIYFQGEDTAGVNHALLYMYTDNTAPYVALFYDGSTRLTTTSGGISVVGTVTSDNGTFRGVQIDNGAVDGGQIELRSSGNGTYNIDNNAGLFRVYGSGTFSGVMMSMTSAGAVTFSDNVTAYSDIRLKSNIRTIDNALEKVTSMRGVHFEKDDKDGTGVIAQELEQIAPELVHDGEEYKSVAYGNLVGYLIEAIKEQNETINTMKAQLESITALLNSKE